MNQYEKRIIDPDIVSTNKYLLTKIGCSHREINLFAERSFSALPAWIRQRIKRLAASQHGPRQQASKAGAIRLNNPREGERTFYMSRLPQHLSKEGSKKC